MYNDFNKIAAKFFLIEITKLKKNVMFTIKMYPFHS